MPSLTGKVKDILSALEAIQATLSLEDRMRLKSELLSVQEDAMRLQEDNMVLRRENENLRRELALRKRLEYIDGLYYVMGDDGDMVGPLCPKCYKGDGVINLLKTESHGYRCTLCKGAYRGNTDPYRSPFE